MSLTQKELLAGLEESANQPRSTEDYHDAFVFPREVFAYKIPPIDFWDGWASPEQVESLLFRSWCDSAERLIGTAGGYDLVREGPYVTPLVETVGGRYIFAVKHDNNGDTWVVSPIKLVHLEDESFVCVRALLNPAWRYEIIEKIR